MIDLKQVAIRVAKEKAARQLQARLAQNAREAREMQLDAKLQAVRAIMASYGVRHYQMTMRMPIVLTTNGVSSAPISFANLVSFSATTEAGELLMFSRNASLEEALDAAVEVVKTLTEDQVVQFWLNEELQGRYYTLRSLVTSETAPHAV